MNVLGIRQNNPGNLRAGAGAQFRGQLPSLDGYARFLTPVYGLRAIAVTLNTYRRLKECPQTVTGIITRWAPGRDHNNVAAYIADVCERTGFDPDELIDVSDREICDLLLRAIVHHENGEQPYSDETINEGLTCSGL